MFKKAVPVYAENLSDKMNTHIILTESLPSLKGYSVKISAASFYKLFINDTFVGFGPARTAKAIPELTATMPHIFYRAENLNLMKTPTLRIGNLTVAIKKMEIFR